MPSLLRDPELDAVLQVRSHQNEVEGQNHVPCPSGQVSFNAVQDTADFLGCKCTWLGHFEILVSQYATIFFLGAALNPFLTQSVFVPELLTHRTLHMALLNSISLLII